MWPGLVRKTDEQDSAGHSSKPRQRARRQKKLGSASDALPDAQLTTSVSCDGTERRGKQPNLKGLAKPLVTVVYFAYNLKAKERSFVDEPNMGQRVRRVRS